MLPRADQLALTGVPVCAERITMAKGGPKTVCRHRKFGWLRGESKLFMQKKFKVAEARFELTILTGAGVAFTSQGLEGTGHQKLSQNGGSLHMIKMQRNGFRYARKCFRMNLASTVGV
jgi:hypothetical protein